MNLKAGRTQVVIDEKSGAITRIEDARTGLVHIPDNPQNLLFRLNVPQGTWTSRYADNLGAAPRVELKTESELRLRWDNLPDCDGAPTGLDVGVVFRAVADTGEVRFRIEIANHGEETVDDLHAPVLSGWTGLGGPGRDTLILGAHTEYDPHRFPMVTGTTYGQLFQKGRAEYPVGLYAPWADLSGPGGGLSLINYMETATAWPSAGARRA